MKLNKILAGVLTCCVIGGALPSVAGTADNTVITANAVDDGEKDYTEGTYELLTYRNYGDFIEITGCDKSATSVVIPAKIGGVPVTSIGDWAFSGSGLTSITIPDSVTSIGYEAFLCCSELTEITIPDSVTSIGHWAFSSCSELTAINVSDNNSNYADIDGVLFNKDKTTLLLYPNEKSGTYTIPDNVTSIGGSAFAGCSGLTEITIPNSVTSIGDGAFHNCSGLTKITIPNGVTSIGEGTFYECSGLTSITLPDSVTSIGETAFYYCSGLTEITIPNSVARIGNYAFVDCRGLTSITLPDSVTRIGEEAFGDCKSLTEITILNPSCEIYDRDITISNGRDFNGTIYGYENSTAQAYAKKYNREFVSLGAALEPTETSPSTDITLLGDANCDGKVSIADSTAILQHLGNEDKYNLSSQGQKNADCCNPGDGITGLDAISIQKLDAKIISSLPEISDKNN